MPVAIYGYETCVHTSRNKRRLRVYENGMLSKIFGPKRVEVGGDWRQLHNDEICDFYPHQILSNQRKLIGRIMWPLRGRREFKIDISAAVNICYMFR